jgi:hypothetical protein
MRIEGPDLLYGKPGTRVREFHSIEFEAAGEWFGFH